MRRPVGFCIACCCVMATDMAAQEREFMLGGTIRPTHRALVAEGAVGRAAGALSGGEALGRFHGAGIYLRHVSGSFLTREAAGAEGTLALTDVRLLVGPPFLNVEAGFLRRHLDKNAGVAPDNLWRTGARASLNLGPSGFSVFAGGSLIIRGPRPTSPDGTVPAQAGQVAGSEGETGVMYQAPRRWPVFIRLGYSFTRIDDITSSGIPRRESLSSVTVSAGLRLISQVAWR